MTDFKIGDIIKGRNNRALAYYGPFIILKVNNYETYHTYEIYDIKRGHVYFSENEYNYEFLKEDSENENSK